VSVKDRQSKSLLLFPFLWGGEVRNLTLLPLHILSAKLIPLSHPAGLECVWH
jgi:hypothetical protein